jgi:hypothetical protein
LAATRIKYKKDKNTGLMYPISSKYRKEWLTILESIGETENHYNQGLNIKRIYCGAELKKETYKPKLYSFR